MAFGCEQLPAGQSLWIRLTAPISTYTAKAGDPVHAVLTQDLVCGSEIVLPMGAPSRALFSASARSDGAFDTKPLPSNSNSIVPLAKPGVALRSPPAWKKWRMPGSRVQNGVIQGIRSSDTFQGLINSRLIHLPTWNPYSDPFLIAYKATFPIFPEPEIYYPAGTTSIFEQ